MLGNVLNRTFGISNSSYERARISIYRAPPRHGFCECMVFYLHTIYDFIIVFQEFKKIECFDSQILMQYLPFSKSES